MICCGFLFCGVFLLLVRGQVSVSGQDQADRIDNQAVVTELPSNDGVFNPQNWRELMAAGDGVHSVHDFLRLVLRNGTTMTADELFSPYLSEDGKLVIAEGGGVMATADECSPRNMSVRLPLDYSNNEMAYYPECTMVQRCGGCCPTQFLSCEPLYKEKIVLKVLRARYLYPGAFSMQWEGLSSVEVERHLSCHCVCRLQSGDCGPLKQFIPQQCKCQCRRIEPCTHNQQWDEETCSCRCQRRNSCCTEGESDDRNCIMFFDPDYCECTLKIAIGAPINATQEEIEAWLASRRNRTLPVEEDQLFNANLDNTPTTTTTIQTTSTSTTTTPHPCARYPRCPPNLIRVLDRHSGRCVCQLRSNVTTRG